MGYLSDIIILWATIYLSFNMGHMKGEDKCYGLTSNVTLINERDKAVAETASLYMELDIYKNGKMNDLVNLLTEKNERLKDSLVQCYTVINMKINPLNSMFSNNDDSVVFDNRELGKVSCGDDSCSSANDGHCDELSEKCSPGTDSTDCSLGM